MWLQKRVSRLADVASTMPRSTTWVTSYPVWLFSQGLSILVKLKTEKFQVTVTGRKSTAVVPRWGLASMCDGVMLEIPGDFMINPESSLTPSP